MAAEPFDPDRHCGAHPDSPKGPCRAPKGRGTDHPGYGRCKHHGGNTPNGRVSGLRAMADDQMAAAAARVEFRRGISRHVDPAQALLEEIARTAGVVDWLGDQVERVVGERVDNLVMGTRGIKRKQAPDGDTTLTEVGPLVHEWFKLWQVERRHLVRVCAETLRAGVEERRVRLAEQQGSLLAGVIRGILGDLDLTAAQQARVPDVVPRHLRMVSGE